MTILWVIHREKRFSSSRTVGILTDGVWAKEMGHRRDFFPYLGGAKHLDLCFFRCHRPKKNGFCVLCVKVSSTVPCAETWLRREPQTGFG